MADKLTAQANIYTLFDSRYTEKKQYNSAWLLSNGQLNDGDVYISAYEALLVELNSTVAEGDQVTLPSGDVYYTKRGLSVKLSTDSDITDYDFVVHKNTRDFRLPIKQLLASGKKITNNETDPTGLYLYYYLGAIYKNAPIVDLARMQEMFAEYMGRDLYYKTPKFVEANKQSVTILAGTQIRTPNGGAVTFNNNTTYKFADILDTGSPSNGKDYYLYAMNDGTIKASLDENLTAGRQFAGFHTLCVDVGNDAPTLLDDSFWSTHPASGYMANDIIPNSVWTLAFHSSAGQKGQVYIEHKGWKFWVDIYLQSGTGKATTSSYAGTVINNRQSQSHAGDMTFVGKELASDTEFMIFSEGSNQKTNIAGSAVPADKKCGGYKDTAGKRMISGFFVECCCGYLWQWGRDLLGGGSNWTAYTDNRRGDTYGVAGVLLLGGLYAYGTHCGSWCRYCNTGRTYTNASVGARGVSKHIEVQIYQTA